MQLAARFGGSDVAVGNALKRQGVQMRVGKRPTRWTGSAEQRAEAVRLYQDLGGVKAVARAFGTRDVNIAPVLESAGVTLKPGGNGRVRFSPEEAQAIRASYEAGASLKSLAEKHGSNATTISATIVRAGGTVRKLGRSIFWTPEKEKYALQAFQAGRSVDDLAGELGTNSASIRRCLQRQGVKPTRSYGAAHPAWQGGRIVDENGYVLILVSESDQPFCTPRSNGYVAEHRLIMGRALARPLTAKETVHHINGDRSDNRLENLQLRFGQHGSGVALSCQDCGSHRIGAAPLS